MAPRHQHRQVAPPDPSPFELAPGQGESASERFGQRIADEARRQEEIAQQSEQQSAAAKRQTTDSSKPEHETPEAAPSFPERLAAETLITLRRESTDWAPRTVTFSAGMTQLAGRRPFRVAIVIFAGQDACTLARTQQDLDGSATSNVMTLAAGANVTIDTEGAVYAKGVAGSTVQVLETFYDQEKLTEAVRLLMRAMKADHIREDV